MTQKHSNYSNYFEAKVPPLSNSNLKLPQGKYCLGIDSTIPFISLQGGGVSQKVFTWGELIEVGPAQQVTVRNESFMEGDIQINSGWDYSAIPPKISVPVNVVTIPGTPFNTYRSLFPADTRRCRRAYLALQFETGDNTDAAGAPLTITFTGKPIKHSYPGTDLVTGQKTYTEVVSFPSNTIGGIVPMGFSSNRGNTLLEPMALTDQVSFVMQVSSSDDAIIFLNSLFFYILEY